METNTLTEYIQHLELRLLQSDLNAHPEYIDELLAEDFEEIDNHGQIHTKSDVIDWLKRKDPNLPWVFENFRVKALSDDMVLAVYSLQKTQQSINSAGSIRTSVWHRQGKHWKMVFHQATKLAGASAS